MSEQIVLLFRSVPPDHPLYKVVESKLLPELLHPVTVELTERASDYANFTNIYRGRYNHLTERKIENYGLLESIENMAAHPGQKRAGSIYTEKYQGAFWVDLEIKNLLGLILIAKNSDAPIDA